MKERREWNPGSRLSRVGGVFSNAFFSKVVPGARRRILEEQERNGKRKMLEEQEGKGGLGEVIVFYRGEEVEVVRKHPFPQRKGPSYLAIRPKGEPAKTAIPLSRKVIREIQLRIPKEKD